MIYFMYFLWSGFFMGNEEHTNICLTPNMWLRNPVAPNRCPGSSPVEALICFQAALSAISLIAVYLWRSIRYL